jgi:cysteinyl-tRNA synthetase
MRRLAPSLFICFLLVLSSGCIQFGQEPSTPEDEMRDLVRKISTYASDIDPGFILIVANGEELATNDGDIADAYLGSIDGVAAEDLYFGVAGLDVPTPWNDVLRRAEKLNRSKDEGKVVMAVDRCSQQGYIWDSMELANEMGFLYFASDSEGLDTVPEYPADPPGAHRGDVTTLTDARNLLLLTIANGWGSRERYLNSLQDTNYDVLVIDAYFNKTPLTPEEVDSLRTKRDGGSRLVVAVMGLGELDERQHVWKDHYQHQPPGWLGKEVPGKPWKHWVDYGEKGWRTLLYRSEESWLDGILNAGFDGVYLAGGDAHLHV